MEEHGLYPSCQYQGGLNNILQQPRSIAQLSGEACCGEVMRPNFELTELSKCGVGGHVGPLRSVTVCTEGLRHLTADNRTRNPHIDSWSVDISRVREHVFCNHYQES